MENPKELRVISAVADKKQVILYLEPDGRELVIKHDDHRLGDLMEKIIPICAKGEVAVINLNDFSIYNAFESKGSGVTKFWRVAKSKVSGWFGGKTETHELHIPEDGKEAILRAVEGKPMTVEEVVEHGKEIDEADTVGQDEVVVAVVTTPDTKEQKVIAGVDNLKPLIANAVKHNNTVGLERFLQRCAAIIDKRQHSVDDLMRFLQGGDLPLADDGSIIAYKMLNYANGSNNTFVDCRTGKVRQKVGSYVCVNESLVDLNRRNECSNGLHIARRDYLRSFDGNVCVLCKIDPEDVMVVPHGDPRKVRVKGYHILGVLSEEAKAALEANKPITAEETALVAVYNSIKGNHIGRIQRVQINGQSGNGLVITDLRDMTDTSNKDFQYTAKDLKSAAAIDDQATGTTLDPREINKRVAAELTKEPEAEPEVDLTEAEITPTKEEEAEVVAAREVGDTKKIASALTDLLLDFDTAPAGKAREIAAQAILDYKKKVKKSWNKLGVSNTTVEAIEAITKSQPAVSEPKKEEPVPAKTNEVPVHSPLGSKVTIAQEARNLFKEGKYAELVAFSKKKKKSLLALGFKDNEIAKIKA